MPQLYQLYQFLSLASLFLIILFWLSYFGIVRFGPEFNFRINRVSGYVFAVTAVLALVFGNILGAIIWGFNAAFALR